MTPIWRSTLPTSPTTPWRPPLSHLKVRGGEATCCESGYGGNWLRPSHLFDDNESSMEDYYGEDELMSYREELSARYDWPLKIHSRGYDAHLVGLQPLGGGEVAAIYRFPGGDSVVFDDEIRASLPAEEGENHETV